MPPYLLLLAIVYGIALSAHDSIEPRKFVGQLLFLRSFNKIGVDLHAIVAVLRHPHLIPNPFSITFNKFVDRDYPILPITGSLGPTWSLSVEEWFYVLWAPVVLLLNRRWIVVVGLSMCLQGLLLRWFISPEALVVRCADILIAGALLAVWMEHRSNLSRTEQAGYDRLFDLAAAASMTVFVTLIVLHRELLSVSFAEVAFAGGVCWLIRHANAPNPVCAALRWRPVVYIGSISYTLYLIHLPMYFLVRNAIMHLFVQMNDGLRYWVVSISSMVLSVAFAALSWTIYEAPILRHKDRVTDWITGRRKVKV